MPNWAYNTITVKNRDDLATLMRKYVNEKGDIDFNKVKKMPDELMIDSGGRDDCCVYYYLTSRLSEPLIGKYAEKLKAAYMFFNEEEVLSRLETLIAYAKEHNRMSELDEMYEAGKVRAENLMKYGAPTWYEWAVKHWGTKWNAAEIRVGTTVDTDTDKKEYCFRFDTAWSGPEPIFERICQENPDMKIRFETEYENPSEGIDVWENQNGVFTHIETKPNPNCYDDDDEEDAESDS